MRRRTVGARREAAAQVIVVSLLRKDDYFQSHQISERSPDGLGALWACGFVPLGCVDLFVEMQHVLPSHFLERVPDLAAGSCDPDGS